MYDWDIVDDTPVPTTGVTTVAPSELMKINVAVAQKHHVLGAIVAVKLQEYHVQPTVSVMPNKNALTHAHQVKIYMKTVTVRVTLSNVM